MAGLLQEALNFSGDALNATRTALGGDTLSEGVTAAERSLWKFLSLKHGSLCEAFSFEEVPYYFLFLQTLSSFSILMLIEQCGKRRLAASIDDHTPNSRVSNSSEETPEDISLLVESEANAASYRQLISWRGVYWLLQTAMCFKQIYSICSVVLQHSESMSGWSRYNLLVYGITQSGSFATMAQAIASNILWPHLFCLINNLIIAKWAHQYGDDSFRACQEYRAGMQKEIEKRRYIPLPDGLSLRISYLYLLILTPIVLTHTFTASILYIWEVLLVAVVYVLLICVAVGKASLENSDDSVLNYWKRFELIVSFLLQYTVTIAFQSWPSIMTRVYAGEWFTGGYLHPVINDVMARTWRSYVYCTLASTERVRSALLDSLLRWT